MKICFAGFPGGSVVKNLPANTGDTGLIPAPGRSQYREATKPVHPNYYACAIKPRSCQLLKPTCPRALFCSKRIHHDEKPAHRD